MKTIVVCAVLLCGVVGGTYGVTQYSHTEEIPVAAEIEMPAKSGEFLPVQYINFEPIHIRAYAPNTAEN